MSSSPTGRSGQLSIQRVGGLRCKVGEGPVWDVKDQALYFVDLLERSVWRHEPAQEQFKRWLVSSFVGSMALRAGGGALVALQDGLYTLDFSNGTVAPFASLPCHPETQCNDGKVDPRGRFLVGTTPRSISDMRPIGGLYSVDASGHARQLDEGFGITNGPCWSPDGRTFYFANSLAKTIYAYDYDLDTGNVSGRRMFADTAQYGGIPDGATCDADGRLWVAICGGAKVLCLRPDGTEERVIAMPVPLIGSVSFGGPALDRLYVTTLNGAELGMGLPSDEHSGSLFVIDGLDVRGMPEPRFAG